MPFPDKLRRQSVSENGLLPSSHQQKVDITQKTNLTLSDHRYEEGAVLAGETDAILPTSHYEKADDFVAPLVSNKNFFDGGTGLLLAGQREPALLLDQVATSPNVDRPLNMSWHAGLVNAFPVPEDHGREALGPLLTESLGTEESVRSFDFLGLPRELRDKVYYFILCEGDRFEPASAAILTASRQCHEEAGQVLYSHTPIRLFFKQEFQSPLTIREVPERYRKWVTTLEMAVGSSWTAPPKHWRVTKSLAKLLTKFEAARRLGVLVELDPSQPLFANFRISETFYTDFCGLLLRNVLMAAPHIKVVVIEPMNHVRKDGPLVSCLRKTVELLGRDIRWAPEDPRDKKAAKLVHRIQGC